MARLCVIANEPIRDCYEKGEIRPRYYNPGGVFEDVHVLSLAATDIPPEPVSELAGDARLSIHPVGDFRLRQLPLWWRQRERVLGMIRSIRPDVIRAQNPILAGWLAVHAGHRLGIPVVVSIHTDYDESLAFQRHAGAWKSYVVCAATYRLTQAGSLRRADRVICVSKFLTRYARRHGATRVVVVYNKVDTSRFVPAPAGCDGDRPLTILSVGRLGREKNQVCLVRAIRGLPVNLVLVGRPDSAREHRELLDAIGESLVSTQVRVIESVPYRDMHRIYQSTDVFALATTHEGMNNTVVEAMACGLPVVVPDIEPLREEVGAAGILVPVCTAEHFRVAFAKLATDRELRETLRVRARARALELDGAQWEAREAALYRELLEERAPRHARL